MTKINSDEISFRQIIGVGYDRFCSTQKLPTTSLDSIGLFAQHWTANGTSKFMGKDHNQIIEALLEILSLDIVIPDDAVQATAS
jgi:hypothetical protein